MGHVAPGSPLRVGCGPYHAAGRRRGGGGRRAEGAHPIGAGSGREQGQRDSPPVAPGRGPHADPHSSPRRSLALGRLPRTPSPRRWYDPPSACGSPPPPPPPPSPGLCLSSSQQRVPCAPGARSRSPVEGVGGNPAPLWKLRSREEGAQRGGLTRWLQGHPGESRGIGAEPGQPGRPGAAAPRSGGAGSGWGRGRRRRRNSRGDPGVRSPQPPRLWMERIARACT